MIKIDPHDRMDLTGPWDGLEACDMACGGPLTCNIGRKWRLMMAEAAPGLQLHVMLRALGNSASST